MATQQARKIWKSPKWLVVLLCVFLSLLLLTTLFNLRGNIPSSNRNIIVALYSDSGTDEECVQATQKMLQWMNCTVALIDAEFINNKGLANFSILCVPGGDMSHYAQDISSNGKENIKNFIRNGGGYIGICGGAYFASEKVIWQGTQLSMITLGVFSGKAEGPNNEIILYPNYTHPNYNMCKVNIVDSAHPITRSESNSLWMLYYWGPVLVPNRDADVTILGNYDRGNQPAMLAFNHGLGRVFLIGTHPEFEEDSDRDGVAFADEFHDPETDWNLMNKAVLWVSNK